VRAYRLAVEASRTGWKDASRLAHDRRTHSLSAQLYRALGSIRANLAEGYSRSSGRDRARFYEYALGSAREAREWYDCGRHVLGSERSAAGMHLLSEIVALLTAALPHERRRTIAR
jgi:four helix bundle protein